MSYCSLIDKYCGDNAPLRHILLTHSCLVCHKALQAAERHPELHLDIPFIEEAAMLHDIGVVLCDAPGISCFGKEPYIRHGLLGAGILREEGLERHARVAICWADKFFSKTPSKLTVEKTPEQVIAMLSRFPDGDVERFRQWSLLFD